MMRLRPMCAVAVCLLMGCVAGCQSPPGRVWSVEELRGPADAATRSALQKNLPKVSFSGIGLADVISFLREVSGANIHVKWDTLSQASVDKKSEVNVQLSNVSVEKALRTILDDVGAVNPLAYAIDGGVVTISTRDDLSTRAVTRVYEVADLIGGGVDEQACTDSLIDLIRRTVRPETWRGGDQAGTTGRVTAFQHKLVILQTPLAHERIALLLEALRERTPLASPGPHRPADGGKRISSTMPAGG